jgi:predicted GTPase
VPRRKVLILGAAGRDFHDFNVVYRTDPAHEVVAFTATQIPNITGRRYPAALAGPLYPEGIPIHAEEELEKLVAELAVDEVVFAYSDVSNQQLMEVGARALAAGADFRLLGPHATMLRAARPVVSVCAVRTGAGKSPTTRRVTAALKAAGLRVVVVRHPMPYGDLARQAVQRFATLDDLRVHECTLEEMEEYEPHLAAGSIVYAGVDYEPILRRAEAEADVIVWDGGNNDLPFYGADLEIVVVDPHRAGHETTYFPGLVNLLRAHVVVVSKVDTAAPADVTAVLAAVHRHNPRAAVVRAAVPFKVDDAERALVAGKRVLVIEDGPTLTHGGMSYGAGVLAARALGARELCDPRPFAVGSLHGVLEAHPRLVELLPAMGYGAAQVAELEETIRRAACDVVVVATPVDLRRVLRIDAPVCRVRYELEEVGAPTLADVLVPVITAAKAGR